VESNPQGQPLTIFSGRGDIPGKLHPVCEACIKKHRATYNGFTSEGKTYYSDGFGVRCNYIPHDEVFIPEIKGVLSEEDLEEMNALKNPLLWGEKYLIDPENGEPWRAWPFQRKMLLCSAIQKVFRCGRRTGKTTLLAVFILWFILTSAGGTKRANTGRLQENLKILIITPFTVHIANIFDRIRAFIRATPGLSECIDRNIRSSPQIISIISPKGAESTITGFASGEASSNVEGKGLSTRGQDADCVILDEGAYISEEAIKGAVLPILYTKPGVVYINCSTPSGIAQDYFESLCTKRPDFVEFHAPATDRPDWSEVESRMREEFGSSEDKWEREVLAEFSKGGTGVIREDLLRLCLSDYEYGDIQPSSEYVFTIGIDWNKEHGTEIAVVGTRVASPHVSFVCLTENIPKKDFSTLNGTRRVIELNRIWNPLWIYPDAGGGDGGAILIQAGREAVGKNAVDARLMTSVVGYDFGSKIELRKADNVLIKYPAKQFLVEHLVRKIELGELRFPRMDALLTKQLQNYIVTRRTPAGQPIYGLKEPKVGDHRLDAVGLALVAVRLQFPDFYTEDFSPVGLGFHPITPRKGDQPREMLSFPRSASISTHNREVGRRGRGAGGFDNVITVWGDTILQKSDGKRFGNLGRGRRLGNLRPLKRS